MAAKRRETVEWLYAFDVHCNAFVPIYVMVCRRRNARVATRRRLRAASRLPSSRQLYVLQYLLLPLLLWTIVFF